MEFQKESLMRSFLSLCLLGAVLPFAGCAEQASYHADAYRVPDLTVASPDYSTKSTSTDIVTRTDNKTPELSASNSAQNSRDRYGNNPTPVDQSNDPQDIAIPRSMRQALVGDQSMSFSARNIKIITANKVMTLRGPVASDSEREAIVDKARTIPGVASVDNQLDIANR
jgi:hypothetical protein